MSIREDISIDWFSSPRIITVASPSVLITIQDLIDTLRSIEHKPYVGADVFSHDFLTWSEGKVQTGAIEYSIIMLTLNNATIGFEARSGPSWVECEITEGTLIAKDSGLNLISPIANNAFVNISYSKAITGALLDSAEQIANAVWVEAEALIVKKMLYNKVTKSGDIATIYEDDGVAIWKQFDLSSDGRVEI